MSIEKPAPRQPVAAGRRQLRRGAGGAPSVDQAAAADRQLRADLRTADLPAFGRQFPPAMAAAAAGDGRRRQRRAAAGRPRQGPAGRAGRRAARHRRQGDRRARARRLPADGGLRHAAEGRRACRSRRRRRLVADRRCRQHAVLRRRPHHPRLRQGRRQRQGIRAHPVRQEAACGDAHLCPQHRAAVAAGFGDHRRAGLRRDPRA